MIQCLKVAKAEYEYTADYVANQPSGIEKAIIETTKYAIARAREKETKENGK